MLMRRKHLAVLSLSCSAILLMLAMSSYKTGPASSILSPQELRMDDASKTASEDSSFMFHRRKSKGIPIHESTESRRNASQYPALISKPLQSSPSSPLKPSVSSPTAFQALPAAAFQQRVATIETSKQSPSMTANKAEVSSLLLNPASRVSDAESLKDVSRASADDKAEVKPSIGTASQPNKPIASVPPSAKTSVVLPSDSAANKGNNEIRNVIASKSPLNKENEVNANKNPQRNPVIRNSTKMVQNSKSALQKAYSKFYPQLFQVALSSAKRRVDTEYMNFPGDINFKPGYQVPKSEKKRILILTTWRSGSTFLGDIFNAYPGAFYSFEPLHELLRKKHFQEGPEKESVITLLQDIMNCKMSNHTNFFDYVRNHSFLFSHNSRYWDACSVNSALCYDPDFFNQVCEIMPVNVLKTVRMGARPVEYLMADVDLDLRVIHLVRDPRGTLHSRSKLNWCKSAVCSDPDTVCNDLLQDLTYAEKLQAKYPDRYMLVRYEDLSTRPHDMTNLILDFVGLSYTESVKKFIDEHTKVNSSLPSSKNLSQSKRKNSIMSRRRKWKFTNAYSTFRDSKSTAFAWRNHLGFESVSKIQKACADPLKILNFKQFNSESELKDYQLSVFLPE